MITKTELEHLDDLGMAAWDRHDAGAFVDLFAERFTWTDWALPEPIRDRAAAKAYFNTWITAFPDMRTKSVLRVVGEDTVSAEIEFTGTNDGVMEMGGNQIPPTHRFVHGRGTYTARAVNGKIVEFRTHPDIAGLMMQLGFLPPT